MLPTDDNSVGMVAINNVLRITRTRYLPTDVHDQDYTGGYQYRADGYPVRVGFFENPGATGAYGFSYAYRNL